ncbi:MAG: signal peptidase II [Pseudomonadota bacterium]|nr:signal peptidase II [Pseudomonadota bacterium]
MSARLGVVVVLLLLAADQASKAAVETYLPFHERVELLPVLSLFRTYNQGIAFSFLSFLPDNALIALTLAIMVFVLWLWRQAHPERIWARIGFALVFGGALGNLVDRLVHGHVIDFILFHLGGWSFAIFNLADSFITIGAVLILIDEFVELRRGAHAEPRETRGETNDE